MAFCTKCGRQLANGEICSCTQEKSNSSVFNPYGPSGSAGTQTDSQTGNQSGNIFSSQNGGITINSDIIKNNIKKQFSEREDTSDNYEKNKQIVPDCVAANDGEIPIKQYDLCRLKTRLIGANAAGRLQITNKRVIFRAIGRSILGRTTFHQEFEIEKLGGVEFRCNHEFSFFAFLEALIVTALTGGIGAGLAIPIIHDGNMEAGEICAVIYGVLVVLCLIGLTVYLHYIKSVKKFYLLKQVLIAPAVGACIAYATVGGFWYDGLEPGTLIGFAAFFGLCALINLVPLSFPELFTCVIKTSGAIPGLEIRHDNPVALLSFLFGGMNQPMNTCGFAEVIPDVDTNIAMREVGTIIDDLQTMGDAAIEKWQDK